MHAILFTIVLMTVLVSVTCLLVVDFSRRPLRFLVLVVLEIIVALLPL